MSQSLNDRILIAAQTMEAIAFFVQDLNPTLVSSLERLRKNLSRITRAKRKIAWDAIAKEIKILRKNYGAIESDSWFRNLYDQICSYPQYSYISKLNVDQKMFRHYDKVFQRWPHVKPHALVVFDGQTNSTTNQIYEMEGALFDDAKLLLDHAREMHGGIKDFKERSKKEQTKLFSYLRLATISIFTYLEAYLNGIAFDCLQLHSSNLKIGDQDFLQEWDHTKNQQRFVSFDRKIFRYPVIVGKANGKTVDLQNCTAAHNIANQGKSLRDALTHPSPYTDQKTLEPEKLSSQITINLSVVENLYRDAHSYTETIEKALGKDPVHSAPWLYR